LFDQSTNGSYIGVLHFKVCFLIHSKRVFSKRSRKEMITYKKYCISGLGDKAPLEKSVLKARCIAFQCRLLWTSVFSYTPKKNLAQIRLDVLEQNAPLIPKNDVTERRLGYSNNQLKICFIFNWLLD